MEQEHDRLTRLDPGVTLARFFAQRDVEVAAAKNMLIIPWPVEQHGAPGV